MCLSVSARVISNVHSLQTESGLFERSVHMAPLLKRLCALCYVLYNMCFMLCALCYVLYIICFKLYALYYYSKFTLIHWAFSTVCT